MRRKSPTTAWIRPMVCVFAAVVVLAVGVATVRSAIERIDVPAPDFTCSPCLNHKPFKLSSLRGKVVLVDFWEYTCINCIRTFPYLKRWNRLYGPLGLVIVGVHTPEFAFAKNPKRVADAVRRFGFTFPVAIDSNYKIWDAFHNRVWPADYLIDKNGKIVYLHLGEGEYGDLERKIRQLLKETNPQLDFNEAKYKIPKSANANMFGGVCRRATPETYLGFARGQNIANPGGEDRARETTYEAPKDVPLDRFALDGRWLAAAQYVRHTMAAKAPGDSVELHYRAKSVYLVGGSDGSKPRRLYVTQDRQPLPKDARGVDVRVGASGRTYVELTGKRMYYVVDNPEFGRHTLRLYAMEPGLSLYSFTFGNNCENKFVHD